MDTYEILERLSEKPRAEIEYAMLTLMLKGKIDFLFLNTAYVKSLEKERKDQYDKMAETNYSLCDLMAYCVRKETKSNSNAIHRALYNMNKSNQFNMNDLNEKYGYDEEKDRKLSWYWRNHNE